MDWLYNQLPSPRSFCPQKVFATQPSWVAHWQRIIPFFAFPPEIRKAIYTTNAIESLNMTLRKVIKNHRTFPTDESALKVVYLALQNISKKWTMPIRDWKAALNRFAIAFEERFPT